MVPNLIQSLMVIKLVGSKRERSVILLSKLCGNFASANQKFAMKKILNERTLFLFSCAGSVYWNDSAFLL